MTYRHVYRAEPKEPTHFGSVSGSEIQNLPFSHSGKGASIYDVRTEGGGGILDIVSNLSKGGCMNLRTMGVKKNPQILRTSYMEAP